MLDRSKSFWVINGSELFKFLERANDGEAPELLYLEIFANSSSEEVEGNDG